MTIQTNTPKINWTQSCWPKSMEIIQNIVENGNDKLASFAWTTNGCRLRKTIAKSLSINSDDSSDDELTDEQLRKSLQSIFKID